MIEKIRILPALMLVSSLLFFIKVGNVWEGAEDLFSGPAEAVAQGADDFDDDFDDDDFDDDEFGDDDFLEEEEDDVFLDLPDDPTLFTRAEIEMLQNLANRRAEIERIAREQELRENLLRITEERIDEKIAELQRIENKIQELLVKHDAEADAKFRRLVKVYESMKPKDAARIFNGLDMTILLEMAERMKESKMAPILANMDSTSAKALTVELANRRSLPATGGE